MHHIITGIFLYYLSIESCITYLQVTTACNSSDRRSEVSTHELVADRYVPLRLCPLPLFCIPEKIFLLVCLLVCLESVFSACLHQQITHQLQPVCLCCFGTIFCIFLSACLLVGSQKCSRTCAQSICKSVQSVQSAIAQSVQSVLSSICYKPNLCQNTSDCCFLPIIVAHLCLQVFSFCLQSVHRSAKSVQNLCDQSSKSVHNLCVNLPDLSTTCVAFLLFRRIFAFCLPFLCFPDLPCRYQTSLSTAIRLLSATSQAWTGLLWKNI